MTHLLTFLIASLPTASATSLDARWQQALQAPPPRAVRLADRLSDRADRLVGQLPSADVQLTGAYDVVISGGGNLGGFYVGVSMVLARVEARGDLSRERWAGASAGGMLPFELELKGERLTLEHHLSYGLLTDSRPLLYSLMPVAAYLQDQHWRQMAEWQTSTYSTSLSSLDDRVFLATSCLTPWPELVMIDHYTAADDQASEAFMATGSLVQDYEGMLCSDGGSLSGDDMTPLFQDGLRDQIVVNLMETPAPGSLVWRLDLDRWIRLVRHGQDAAIAFLASGGAAPGASLTLCPAGSQVDTHVCLAP